MGYLNQMIQLRRVSVAALLSALLWAVGAQAASSPGSRTPLGTGAISSASVSVKECRSNPWYAGRELGFRTRMALVGPMGGQRLEVTVDLWRKLNEQRSFHRLKIAGLVRRTMAKDHAATVYEREIAVKNVETAARYRLKANFLWRNTVTGEVERRRTVWSKTCRQRSGLPKLTITRINSLQLPGSNMINNTVTVTNSGRSEAMNVPLAIDPDNSDAVFATIPSIGPGRSEEVTIVTPSCQQEATAQIDPRRLLKRLRGPMRKLVAVANCR
jgi:hypothetical protein